MESPSHAHYSGLVTPGGMTCPSNSLFESKPKFQPNLCVKGDSEKWLCCSQCKKCVVAPTLVMCLSLVHLMPNPFFDETWRYLILLPIDMSEAKFVWVV